MITQENKDLLLIDLLARLPYNVKIRLGDYDYQVCGYNSEKELPVKIWYYYDSNQTLKSYIDVYLTDYRPYLRPMSSMTEEEKFEYFSFISDQKPFDSDFCAYPKEHRFIYEWDVTNYVKWLNSHHFDYRGLIEKELAIAVTEKNNPYKS